MITKANTLSSVLLTPEFPIPPPAAGCGALVVGGTQLGGITEACSVSGTRITGLSRSIFSTGSCCTIHVRKSENLNTLSSSSWSKRSRLNLSTCALVAPLLSLVLSYAGLSSPGVVHRCMYIRIPDGERERNRDFPDLNNPNHPNHPEGPIWQYHVGRSRAAGWQHSPRGGCAADS